MIQHRGKFFPTSNQRRAYSFQQMWKLYATILHWDWNELNIGFKLFTNHCILFFFLSTFEISPGNVGVCCVFDITRLKKSSHSGFPFWITAVKWSYLCWGLYNEELKLVIPIIQIKAAFNCFHITVSFRLNWLYLNAGLRHCLLWDLPMTEKQNKSLRSVSDLKKIFDYNLLLTFIKLFPNI